VESKDKLSKKKLKEKVYLKAHIKILKEEIRRLSSIETLITTYVLMYFAGIIVQQSREGHSRIQA
jgi:hypothetical protein